MHQPLPRIPPPAENAAPAGSWTASARPEPSVPRKVVFVALIGFVLAMAGSSLPMFNKPAPDKPVAVGKVILDPDGDDPRLELLYHWQDPRFAHQERTQIFWMANGLALLGIWTLGKRMGREARP